MRVLNEEAGLTLVELLVSMIIIAIVTGALITGVLALYRGHNEATMDFDALASLRTSVDRFSKELRQAGRIYSDSSAKKIRFWVDYDRDYTEDTNEQITWQIEDLGAGRGRLVRFSDAAPSVVKVVAPEMRFDAATQNFGYNSSDVTSATLIRILLGVQPAHRQGGRLGEERIVRTEVRLRNVSG